MSTTGTAHKDFADILYEHEKMFLSKKEYLETQVEVETNIALANAVSNKHAAFTALKRKRLWQKHQTMITATLQKIQDLQISLNNVSVILVDNILKEMESIETAVKETIKKLDSETINICEWSKEAEAKRNGPAVICDKMPCHVPVSAEYEALCIEEGEIMDELENIQKEVLNQKSY